MLCAASPCPRAAPVARRAPANTAPSQPIVKPVTSDTWDYTVTTSPGARELFVEARFPAGSGTELGIDDEVTSFVRDLCLVTGPRCESPAMQGASWYIPDCQ